MAQRISLVSAVFASGFVITGVEMSVGRLLAPWFGMGMTVWAAVIASVITALALGYPLGGWLVDRRPSARVPFLALLLGTALAVAAGLLLPTLLNRFVQDGSLYGRGSLLGLALLLFCIPCVLLAAVAPSVLRLTLRSPETAGRDSGLLYALGSVGSVLGVLLPSLWWIPIYGLRASFLTLAAIGVLPALAGLFLHRERAARASVAALLLLLLAGFAPLPAPPSDISHTEIVTDRESPMQHVRILKHRLTKSRFLVLNEGFGAHSVYNPNIPVTGLVWDWMAVLSTVPLPDDGARDVLILGLASGTVSNIITQVLNPDFGPYRIDGVEIDPLVLELSREHMGLDESLLRAHVADARPWLQGSGRSWDIIYVDAYRQPAIPAHLSTVEFFEEVKAHLSPGGLAVLNVHAGTEPGPVVNGLARTWAAVFPDALAVEGDDMNGFSSRLFLGGNAVDRLPLSTDLLGRMPRLLLVSAHLINRKLKALPIPPAGRVWTDDRVPVEVLTERAERKLRAAARQGDSP